MTYNWVTYEDDTSHLTPLQEQGSDERFQGGDVMEESLSDGHILYISTNTSCSWDNNAIDGWINNKTSPILNIKAKRRCLELKRMRHLHISDRTNKCALSQNNVVKK